ncbi:MAG: hypothetical protein ACQEP8_00885 [Chlamydiota bacterium]
MEFTANSAFSRVQPTETFPPLSPISGSYWDNIVCIPFELDETFEAINELVGEVGLIGHVTNRLSQDEDLFAKNRGVIPLTKEMMKAYLNCPDDYPKKEQVFQAVATVLQSKHLNPTIIRAFSTLIRDILITSSAQYPSKVLDIVDAWNIAFKTTARPEIADGVEMMLNSLHRLKDFTPPSEAVNDACYTLLEASVDSIRIRALQDINQGLVPRSEDTEQALCDVFNELPSYRAIFPDNLICRMSETLLIIYHKLPTEALSVVRAVTAIDKALKVSDDAAVRSNLVSKLLQIARLPNLPEGAQLSLTETLMSALFYVEDPKLREEVQQEILKLSGGTVEQEVVCYRLACSLRDLPMSEKEQAIVLGVMTHFISENFDKEELATIIEMLNKWFKNNIDELSPDTIKVCQTLSSQLDPIKEFAYQHRSKTSYFNIRKHIDAIQASLKNHPKIISTTT